MKTYFVQLICWGSLLTVLTGCSPKEQEVVGAVIETAILNGLVPGSALTLKGREFGTVQSITFANTTVAVGQFIRTAANEVTIKVPIGTQAGEVRVVGEKGPGQPKQMLLLTGASGMTTDNVSTNVNTVTQGYYSDDCSPNWFSYCLQGSCISFYNGFRGSLGSRDCSIYNFTTERIANSVYNVYKGKDATGTTRVTLKCEINSGVTGLTGLVIMETPDSKTYFGSVFKSGDVVGYSTDGREMKLCKPVYTPNRPFNGPCSPNFHTCSACQ